MAESLKRRNSATFGNEKKPDLWISKSSNVLPEKFSHETKNGFIAKRVNDFIALNIEKSE